VRRLFLVRHAATSATRAVAFPVDEPLDQRALSEAAALADVVPARLDVLCSPALRTRATAEAARLGEPRIDPALAECDFGAWAGRTLEDVGAGDPGGVGAWMTDPDAQPHGGESLSAFAARVAEWLDGQAALDGGAVAITHGGVSRRRSSTRSARRLRRSGASTSRRWRSRSCTRTTAAGR
jgi:broad specificity phosphatase PhoE